MITRPRTPHGKAQGTGGASIGEGSRAAPTGLVERCLPKAEADVAECHETLVDALAELVFDIAEDFDLLSIPAVYAIFWLRALVLRAPRPDRDDLRGLVRQTTNMGWGELERRPARELVMGAAVQPWLSEPVFEPLPPGDFRTWAEPDHVKIVWTLESEALGPARTERDFGHARVFNRPTARRVGASDGTGVLPTSESCSFGGCCFRRSGRSPSPDGGSQKGAPRSPRRPGPPIRRLRWLPDCGELCRNSMRRSFGRSESTHRPR